MTDVDCVLFDLDGTLVDTAPDMAAALDALRAENGLQPMGLDRLRNHVSHGAVGLLKVGMPATDAATHETWRLRFLDLYASALCVDSRLFEGLEEVLQRLELADRLWGVVTNKPGWLAEPLMHQLQLAHRSACLIAGDSLPQRKPHPEPLLHACRQLGVTPESTAYVGDAERDIQAARAAGCQALVAEWGYIESHEQPSRWGGDAMVECPHDLIGLFFKE
jgi:phosphoglycolate phosphatase